MMEVVKMKIKRLFALFVFFAALMLCFDCAYADEIPGINISVEQTFKVSGEEDFTTSSLSADDEFHYALYRATGGSPMPQGSSEGVYNFTLKGNQSINIGEIPCPYQGHYEYELRQIIPKDRGHYIFDERAYIINLYVRSDSDGKLYALLFIVNDKGEKAESAHFENEYIKPSNTPVVSEDIGDTYRTAPVSKPQVSFRNLPKQNGNKGIYLQEPIWSDQFENVSKHISGNRMGGEYLSELTENIPPQTDNENGTLGLTADTSLTAIWSVVLFILVCEGFWYLLKKKRKKSNSVQADYEEN